MATTRTITDAELLGQPRDARRYELVDGEIRASSGPPLQLVEGRAQHREGAEQGRVLDWKPEGLERFVPAVARVTMNEACLSSARVADLDTAGRRRDEAASQNEDGVTGLPEIGVKARGPSVQGGGWSHRSWALEP